LATTALEGSSHDAHVATRKHDALGSFIFKYCEQLCGAGVEIGFERGSWGSEAEAIGDEVAQGKPYQHMRLIRIRAGILVEVDRWLYMWHRDESIDINIALAYAKTVCPSEIEALDLNQG
jgi:hypothetical protein